MASKGAAGEEDFEEVDVAAAASRLVNMVAAVQAEDVDVKKCVVPPSERTMVQEDGVL